VRPTPPVAQMQSAGRKLTASPKPDVHFGPPEPDPEPFDPTTAQRPKHLSTVSYANTPTRGELMRRAFPSASAAQSSGAATLAQDIPSLNLLAHAIGLAAVVAGGAAVLL